MGQHHEHKGQQRHGCLNRERWSVCFWGTVLALSPLSAHLLLSMGVSTTAVCLYWGRLVGATYRMLSQGKC